MATPLITNHYLRQILKDLAAKGLSFDAEDNVLNYHDRYAYHLQLLMINDRESEQNDIDRRILDKTERYIVIAESGVTAGFNIVDCEIKDAVSHNFRTKNASSVEVDMTIAEPYNMSLPDKMFESSRQLGVLNWRLAPIFLVLYFDYYDEEGKLVPNTDNNFYKVYKLNIVDFENTLTAAGSIYKLKAAVNNNMGFKNNYFILPQSYTITSGPGTPALRPPAFRANLPGAGPGPAPGTVGDFFEKLQKEINQFYLNLRRSSDPSQQQTQVVFYEFFVADPLNEQKIKFNPRINNRRASFRQVGNNIEITVGRGISIGVLVDDICASIENLQFFVPDDSSGIIRVPWIECVVKNIGWDFITNDYVRQFTYHINVKETRRAVPSQEFGRAFQLLPNFHNARLQSISQSTVKVLKKAYLYFYTGNNTEIINLDVKFNHLHVLSLPITTNSVLPNAFSAVSTDLGSVVGALTDRQRAATVIPALEAELRRLGDLRARQVGPARAATDAQITTLIEQIREEIEKDNRARAVLASGSVVVFDPDTAQMLEDRYGLFGQFTNPVVPLRGQLQREREAGRQRRRPIEFTEDEFTTVNQLVPSQLTYIRDPRDIINQLRPPNSGDVDSDARKVYATVTQQIYARMQDMVNITMEIRGDPYWLGASNIERDRQLSEGETLNDDFAVYQPYDAFFLLAFRAGSIPDEKTGFMDLRDDVDFFNALYIAVQVTHIFREGKFTQRIEATRDPLSNLNEVRSTFPTIPAVVNTGINQ